MSYRQSLEDEYYALRVRLEDLARELERLDTEEESAAARAAQKARFRLLQGGVAGAAALVFSASWLWTQARRRPATSTLSVALTASAVAVYAGLSTLGSDSSIHGRPLALPPNPGTPAVQPSATPESPWRSADVRIVAQPSTASPAAEPLPTSAPAHLSTPAEPVTSRDTPAPVDPPAPPTTSAPPQQVNPPPSPVAPTTPPGLGTSCAMDLRLPVVTVGLCGLFPGAP